MSQDGDRESEVEVEAWADILERRSPDRGAVVNELREAEASVLAIQSTLTVGSGEDHAALDDFAALTVAMAEVDRLRLEVYRLARQ